jgi:Ca2+-binding RTX toxin-like protein
MRNHLSFLPLSCLMVFALAGCGTSATPSTSDDPFQAAEEQLTPLGTQCTFVASSGLMTVTVAAGETAIISRRAADSAILQNGASCDVLATSGTLKQLKINGAATGTGKEVILDFTNGLFATGTASAGTTGILVDLGTATGNTLGLRGTAAADNIAYGLTGVNLNNDAFKDIDIQHVSTNIVYLGDGADTFTAAGGTGIGAAFGAALTVYGGAGADMFNQGALATPSETIYGGADVDTVSYTLRTAPVTVTVGAGTTNDGLTGEGDDIKNDVEIITGGTAADILTAAPTIGITLNGGPGNDTLIGDTGIDTLNGEAGNDILRGKGGNDIENGGDNDDTFDEETTANGGDIFNGGNGIDTVDYSGRLLVGVVVTMDGVTANDGTAGENDNVKADVENVLGSAFADSITGNASNNKITGNAGADTLIGGAGDDVFDMGTSTVLAGADVISGGLGVDTVDYSARTGDLTVALDGTATSGEATELATLNTDLENVLGGAGDDSLTGNASNNELVGGLGDDHLYGMAGDDVLEGGGLAQINVLDCGPGDGDIGYGVGTGTGAGITNCEF